jgi:hypothetical protein
VSPLSPNRQGRDKLRTSGARSVSPSPIRYGSPGGLATHLSHRVTSKSSKEAAATTAASSGLRLTNLTPPGSRKYGTYSMGGNYERSDCSGAPYSATVKSNMPKTPPVSRKVGTSSPTYRSTTSAGKPRNPCWFHDRGLVFKTNKIRSLNH